MALTADDQTGLCHSDGVDLRLGALGAGCNQAAITVDGGGGDGDGEVAVGVDAMGFAGELRSR